MDAQEKALVRDFPELFRYHPYHEDTSNSHHIYQNGIDCGKGWYKLIRNVCREYTDLDGIDVAFREVSKRNFGLYISHTGLIDEDNLYSPEELKEMEELLRSVRGISLHVCEFCGAMHDEVNIYKDIQSVACVPCAKQRGSLKNVLEEDPETIINQRINNNSEDLL